MEWNGRRRQTGVNIQTYRNRQTHTQTFLFPPKPKRKWSVEKLNFFSCRPWTTFDGCVCVVCVCVLKGSLVWFWLVLFRESWSKSIATEKDENRERFVSWCTRTIVNWFYIEIIYKWKPNWPQICQPEQWEYPDKRVKELIAVRATHIQWRLKSWLVWWSSLIKLAKKKNNWKKPQKWISTKFLKRKIRLRFKQDAIRRYLKINERRSPGKSGNWKTVNHL